MKSVILIGPVPPPHGGMATYLSTLAQCLQSSGYRVNIENTTAGQTRNILLSKIAKVSRFLGISLRVAHDRSQVIHGFTGSQDNFLAIGIILWIARLSGKKVFLRISGGDFPGMVAGAGYFKKAVIRNWLKAPHYVIAVSDAIGIAACQAGVPPERVLRISSALPISPPSEIKFIPEQVSNFRKLHNPIVICVGAFQEHYGIHLLLEATGRLRDRYPEIGLLLIMKNRPDIGGGPYENKILKQIVTLGLANAVEILRDIPRSQVLDILELGDLFVRSTLIDGDSNSIREAMVRGMPVVASKAGQRPDGIRLYEPYDLYGLKKKMLEALTDTARRLPYSVEAEATRNLELIMTAYESSAMFNHSPI